MYQGLDSHLGGGYFFKVLVRVIGEPRLQTRPLLVKGRLVGLVVARARDEAMYL